LPHATLVPYTTLFRSISPTRYGRRNPSRRTKVVRYGTRSGTIRGYQQLLVRSAKGEAEACCDFRDRFGVAAGRVGPLEHLRPPVDRKSTRLNSSHSQI